MFRSRRIRSRLASDTDEAFLDSSNLPGFNSAQLEGKFIRTLSLLEVGVIGALCGVALCTAVYRGYILQVEDRTAYASLAENNRFERVPDIALRGVIEDRFGYPLAWNEVLTDENGFEEQFAKRVADTSPALAHSIGYVREPARDKKGNWWRPHFEPHGGVEEAYNDILSGENGVALTETDAAGKSVAYQALQPAVDGLPVRLSLDADLTRKLYTALKSGAQAGFLGGAGVIMDIHSGELIATTSYPSFDLSAFTRKDGQDDVQTYLTSTRYPLLDRVYQGAYLPGSIVKPFVALAALEEGIIAPSTGIVSIGKLVIPNPFHPDKPSVFKDWKAHGWTDMRMAIGVSSDVYFYTVGGGFGNQKGLGIAKLHDWMTRFGFGEKTGLDIPGELAGNVPTPAWKRTVFPDDTEWNIGNTYHSSIGQYGWLTTPLQAVRATAALANGGTLYAPTLVRASGERAGARTIEMQKSHVAVVLEGMAYSVEKGTAQALNIPGVAISAKTGTAEVGARKEHMNSWVIGVWPRDNPIFAFAVVLEKAPAGTLRGAAPAMKSFFEELVEEKSPYVKGEYPERSYAIEQEKKKGEAKKKHAPKPDVVGFETVIIADEEIIPIPATPAFVPDSPL